ncbi:MAG: hypothetical protein NUV52_04535 [Candidatus Roizmanbacteria bacterium]|nr:hypothetical protein [Candidatus Roizmanbacteria bacterium]
MNMEVYKLIRHECKSPHQPLMSDPDPRESVFWQASTFPHADVLSINPKGLATFVHNDLDIPHKMVLSPRASENSAHAKIEPPHRLHLFLDLPQDETVNPYEYRFVQSYAYQAQAALHHALADAIVLNWSSHLDEYQRANLAVSTAIAGGLSSILASSTIQQVVNGNDMDWSRAASAFITPFYVFMINHVILSRVLEPYRFKNKSLHRTYNNNRIEQDTFIEYVRSLMPVNEVQRLIVPSLKLATIMPHDIFVPSPDSTEYSFVPPRK